MRVSSKLAIIVLMVTVLCGALGWWALDSYRASFTQRIQTMEVQRSGKALQQVLNRVLEREWTSIAAVSKTVDMTAQPRMQSMTDTIPMASNRVASAAVVAPDGKVLAQTGGAGIGMDLSSARWFRNALSGPYLGAPVTDSAGQGVMNMSHPILDAQGNLEGVLLFRLRLDWMQEFLAQSAEELGLDAFVVDSEGQMLLSASNSAVGPPSLTALQASRLNLTGGMSQIDTQERGYATAIVPKVLGKTIPANTWSLIVRTANSVPAALSQAAWLQAEMTLLAILGLGAVIVLAVLRIYLSPVERQSRALLGFARGEMTYPREFRNSREARDLGEALALLQTRMDELLSQASRMMSRRGERGRAGLSAQPIEREEYDPEAEERATASSQHRKGRVRRIQGR